MSSNIDPRVSTLLNPHSTLTIEQPTDLQFGCARYVVAGLEVNNTLTVHIMGPTIWVIRGDMNIDAPMTIDITDGASPELIVDGALNVDNTLTIGDAAHPTLVSVERDVRISSPTHNFGALLAPTSAISVENTLDCPPPGADTWALDARVLSAERGAGHHDRRRRLADGRALETATPRCREVSAITRPDAA